MVALALLLASVHGSPLETYTDKLKRQLAINAARATSSRVSAGRALGGGGSSSADNFFAKLAPDKSTHNADQERGNVPKEAALRHLPGVVAGNRFDYAHACGGEAWLVGEHPDAVDRTQSLKWSKVAWARHALQFFPSVEYVLWVHPARFERTIS